MSKAATWGFETCEGALRQFSVTFIVFKGYIILGSFIVGNGTTTVMATDTVTVLAHQGLRDQCNVADVQSLTLLSAERKPSDFGARSGL